MPPDKHLVFVYGTLKRGGCNHYRLHGATFVAQARTVANYPLVIKGLPYLFDVPGVGVRVKGEVFLVSNATLRSLDMLEGHPYFYRRRFTTVMPLSGEVADTTLRVQAYFVSHQYIDKASQQAIANNMQSYPNNFDALS